MNALFKSISRFFQRLFGLSDAPFERRDFSPTSSPSLADSITGSDVGARRQSLPEESLTPQNDPNVTPKLRRLVYEVAYRLRQDKPTQGAQVGPVFRRVDPDFSVRRYGFNKVFDLLAAVPSLVSIEKEELNNANTQFIFYVRPVNDVRTLLTEAVESYRSEDGWVHEDSLKEAIAQNAPNFSVQTFGFSTFRTFIESRHDLLEFKEAGSPYIRLFPKKAAPPQITRSNRPQALPVIPDRQPSRPTPTPVISTKPTTNQKINIHLVSFARLSEEELNQSIYELADLADNEPWHFGSEPPADFPHSILRNYVRHMFTRLQHEEKVISSQDGQFYTFHTNLYDKLRRPIYALMTQKPRAEDDVHPRPALKLEFCVPGEDAGKNLVGQFGGLPAAANFMTTPHRFFYYWEAGAPTVNWKHVIEDNMDRLPHAFLRQYFPAFMFLNTDSMSKIERGKYKSKFNEMLDADAAAYREIVSRLESALNLTMLRIQLNYKVAVPTYFASHDRVDLMLPMSLLSEASADCVIVVKRERSGNYSGNTILTMEQAYNNARLIYRPIQRWLVHPETLKSQPLDESD